MWLITFDIDGTMEFGDPPGVLTHEHIDYFRSRGAIIGSASDRPQSAQVAMWSGYGAEVDFTIMKHRMPELRERYPEAETYWHVGDRPVDQQIAEVAKFTFFWPDQFPSPETAEDFFSQAHIGVEEGSSLDNGSPSLAEAALKLAAHALDGERAEEDLAIYDQFASSGRVEGDDLGSAFPI